MHPMQEAAKKMADRITEEGKGSWSAPHALWPFIDQLRQRGLSIESACWLIRNWLGAGWVPPSVVADDADKQIAAMQEEMQGFKKTMADMQQWYSKLDDFLKIRDQEKIENKTPVISRVDI